MAEQLKTIKNTSAVAQSIIFKGLQFVLQPFDEQTFDAAIADKFLELCAPLVSDATSNIADTYAPDLQLETVWVANMTGSPEAPDKIEVSTFTKNRRWEKLAIPNPNKDARTISREMKGGHRQFFGKDGGMIQESLIGKVYAAPPYRRTPMPKVVADWFLMRDANAHDSRGAVIKSRPPSSFEPDMHWPLAEMRTYLRLIDPMCKLPMGDDELKGRAVQEQWTEQQAKEELRKAKHECLKILYFRVVDPKYRLPTREEFAEFYSGKSAEEVTKQELAAILSSEKDAKIDAEIRKAGQQNRK
jgi:hypothetical protein